MVIVFSSFFVSSLNAAESRTAELMRKSAEKGDSDSMLFLAFMYRKGEGVSKDLYKAIEWYKKAAGSGSASALMSVPSGFSGAPPMNSAIFWMMK